MATSHPKWKIDGEYFENCNCDVVCPCEVSPQGFLGAKPDQGHCNVWFVFHVNDGTYGDVSIGGLNFVIAIYAPDVMGLGNWTVAAYCDERASAEQTEALATVLTGAAGGPMGAVAPLIATNLGLKRVPIEYVNEGKKRSARIPGILDSAIAAVPGAVPEGVVVKQGANPMFPEDWVQASGVRGTFKDFDFDWDNTGKCADYAPFHWTGP